MTKEDRELKELLQQKAELEERIRQFKSGTIIQVGKAKLWRDYHRNNGGDWYVAIDTADTMRCRQNTRFCKIACADDRSVVDAIPEIVQDLNELYRRAKEQDA